MKTHLLPIALLLAGAAVAIAEPSPTSGYFQKAAAARETSSKPAAKKLSDAVIVYSKIWNEMYGPGKYKLMFKASVDTLDDGTPNVALRYNEAYITVRLEVNDARYEKWKKASHKLIADSHLGFKPKKLVDPWDKNPRPTGTTDGFGKRKKMRSSFGDDSPNRNRIKAEATDPALLEMKDPDARVIGGKPFIFGKAEEAAIKEWEESGAAQAAKLLVRVTAVDSDENEVGHWDIGLKQFKRSKPYFSTPYDLPLHGLSRLKDLPTSVFKWNDEFECANPEEEYAIARLIVRDVQKETFDSIADLRCEVVEEGE